MASRSGRATEPRLPAGTASKGPLKARAGAPISAVAITLIIGFVALGACLVLIGSLAEDIRGQEVNALDTLATPFLHGLASPALDQLMTGFTTLGSNLGLVPLFLAAVIVLVRLRRPRELLFLVIASGGSLVLNETMKLIFQRPRPQLSWAHVQPDYSFPSGHTMNSLVLFVALAIVIWSVAGPRIGLTATIVGIALSLCIGVSRVYLGYHYLTDVVAGLAAGTAWLLIVASGFRFGPIWGLWRDKRPAAGGRTHPARKGRA
jgi:membrane-associated phospholipid phosphatase